jgi:hypothetical protein
MAKVFEAHYFKANGVADGCTRLTNVHGRRVVGVTTVIPSMSDPDAALVLVLSEREATAGEVTQTPERPITVIDAATGLESPLVHGEDGAIRW